MCLTARNLKSANLENRPSVLTLAVDASAHTRQPNPHLPQGDLRAASHDEPFRKRATPGRTPPSREEHARRSAAHRKGGETQKWRETQPSDSFSPRLLGRSPWSQSARRPCGTEPPWAFPVSPEPEPSAEVSSWPRQRQGPPATAATALQSLPAPQIENKVAPAASPRAPASVRPRCLPLACAKTTVWQQRAR